MRIVLATHPAIRSMHPIYSKFAMERQCP
jgi:hypothetical protein